MRAKKKKNEEIKLVLSLREARILCACMQNPITHGGSPLIVEGSIARECRIRLFETLKGALGNAW